MARCAFWAYPYFQCSVDNEGYISLYDARAAILYRCVYNEYFGVETDSELEFQNVTGSCRCEACIVVHGSCDSVFGDTVYSPDLFVSSENSTINSDDTTICNDTDLNLSDEETQLPESITFESNTFESYFSDSSDTLNSSFSSSIHVDTTDDEDRRDNLIRSGKISANFFYFEYDSASSSHSVSLISGKIKKKENYDEESDSDSDILKQ